MNRLIDRVNEAPCLAIRIEVGVVARAPGASRLQRHQRRHSRVLGRAVDVKHEAAPKVWRVLRACIMQLLLTQPEHTLQACQHLVTKPAAS